MRQLFEELPPQLREELIRTFQSIAQNYRERRWEPAELNGGKLCEVVYTIVSGALAGEFQAKAFKPKNMFRACLELENAPKTHPAERSLRILIPRTLISLYDVRNNRGVGHVGGDVDPNEMDASLVYNTSSWLLAELIRVFHATSTAEATALVHATVERRLPVIWEMDGIRRVLLPEMNVRDQVLLLLQGGLKWVSVADLVMWTDYANISRMRSAILAPLHRARLVEYDRKNNRAMITTLGSDRVERDLLRSAA